jgi:hypothetical protein
MTLGMMVSQFGGENIPFFLDQQPLVLIPDPGGAK